MKTNDILKDFGKLIHYVTNLRVSGVFSNVSDARLWLHVGPYPNILILRPLIEIIKIAM